MIKQPKYRYDDLYQFRFIPTSRLFNIMDRKALIIVVRNIRIKVKKKHERTTRRFRDTEQK